MRALVPGLPSPHPLLDTLPGLYHGQPFVAGLCDALDRVLAPVLLTLDTLPSYLDVETAPPDYLPWLAFWIGMPVSPSQSTPERRQALRAATTEQAWQGTARGIALVVEAVCGVRATVEDSGGTAWSADPDAAPPEQAGPGPGLVVRVHVPAGRAVDERRLDRLVATLKPAHVAHRTEVATET